jgi:hypothetical protein
MLKLDVLCLVDSSQPRCCRRTQNRCSLTTSSHPLTGKGEGQWPRTGRRFVRFRTLTSGGRWRCSTSRPTLVGRSSSGFRTASRRRSRRGRTRSRSCDARRILTLARPVLATISTTTWPSTEPASGSTSRRSTSGTTTRCRPIWPGCSRVWRTEDRRRDPSVASWSGKARRSSWSTTLCRSACTWRRPSSSSSTAEGTRRAAVTTGV